jgi:hypothetical protein
MPVEVKKAFLEAGGVTQVIEHLRSKLEALNSNPSTSKKRIFLNSVKVTLWFCPLFLSAIICYSDK